MCDTDIADDAHEPERWAPQQTPRHCSCSFHLGDTKRPSQSAFLTLTKLAAWQNSFASDGWYMRCITLRTGMALFTCPRYLHLTQPISSILQRLLYPSSSSSSSSSVFSPLRASHSLHRPSVIHSSNILCAQHTQD